MKRLRWLSIRLAVIYLGVIVVLSLLENWLVYPAPRDPTPPPTGPPNPNDSYEEVYFHSTDGTQLHGRLFHDADDQGYLIYCHGNGDMVTYLTPYLGQLHRELDLTTFVFDYRGYGRSAGSPHELGLIADGTAAMNWLQQRFDVRADKIILMGRSIGGGVAVAVAAEQNPRALILQNTFSTLPDVAAKQFPWIPVQWVMRNRYNSVAKIAQIHCPLLQSHGAADHLIPLEIGQRLFAAANEPKQLVVMEGRGHNDPETPTYDEALVRFVRDLDER